MQKCTACGNSIATIHVLDLEGGSVVQNHYLCDNCAEAKGVVQAKSSNPLNLSTEILENLLGDLKGKKTGQTITGPEQPAEETGPADGLVCPGCHLTAAEFKMRGRLGCPRCYDVFRNSLIPLLERVHDATSHRGRYPGRTVQPPKPAVNLAELRLSLSRAIEKERYEEAAKLRDEIRQAQDAMDPE